MHRSYDCTRETLSIVLFIKEYVREWRSMTNFERKYRLSQMLSRDLHWESKMYYRIRSFRVICPYAYFTFKLYFSVKFWGFFGMISKDKRIIHRPPFVMINLFKLLYCVELTRVKGTSIWVINHRDFDTYFHTLYFIYLWGWTSRLI